MQGEAHRTRRGPKPNPDRGTPSGYRVSARQRFELQVAAPFVGARNLQETIDMAVAEFLGKMAEVSGFSDAVSAAEASQRARAGVQVIGSPSMPDAATTSGTADKREPDVRGPATRTDD